MAADIKEIEKKAEAKMASSIEFLDESLAHIRAGKANPRILDGIKLDYYGSLTPLSGVASISTPDARTIIVQPWEKSMMRDIEKAIMDSDVGVTPDNNGEVIRLSIPPLTEERRKLLVKQSKHEAEEAKISVRNARRDAIDAIKKSVKDGLPEDVAKDGESEMKYLQQKKKKY
jgi:ribosome recycling factor